MIAAGFSTTRLAFLVRVSPLRPSSFFYPCPSARAYVNARFFFGERAYPCEITLSSANKFCGVQVFAEPLEIGIALLPSGFASATRDEPLSIGEDTSDGTVSAKTRERSRSCLLTTALPRRGSRHVRGQQGGADSGFARGRY